MKTLTFLCLSALLWLSSRLKKKRIENFFYTTYKSRLNGPPHILHMLGMIKATKVPISMCFQALQSLKSKAVDLARSLQAYLHSHMTTGSSNNVKQVVSISLT